MEPKPDERKALAKAAFESVKQIAESRAEAGPAVIVELRRHLDNIERVSANPEVRELGANILSYAEAIYDDRPLPERAFGPHLVRQVRLAGAIQQLEYALREAGLLEGTLPTARPSSPKLKGPG